MMCSMPVWSSVHVDARSDDVELADISEREDYWD